MVMRNRHEGSDTNWWDDLPPGVRSRVTRPVIEDSRSETSEQPAHGPQPPFTRSDLLYDLSKFAMAIIFASSLILLYLLVALTYVNG